jgi:hypothetical protein
LSGTSGTYRRMVVFTVYISEQADSHRRCVYGPLGEGNIYMCHGQGIRFAALINGRRRRDDRSDACDSCQPASPIWRCWLVIYGPGNGCCLSQITALQMLNR